ncbi:MAG: OadG family transporter subunit [Pseudomonadota bacterium]
MTPSLLAQGTELLIYGMGTVVVFLALLVVAIRAMSHVVQTFFPEPPAPLTPARTPTRAPATAPAPSADSVLMAAGVAAVHAHRARSSNNTP